MKHLLILACLAGLNIPAVAQEVPEEEEFPQGAVGTGAVLDQILGELGAVLIMGAEQGMQKWVEKQTGADGRKEDLEETDQVVNENDQEGEPEEMDEFSDEEFAESIEEETVESARQSTRTETASHRKDDRTGSERREARRRDYRGDSDGREVRRRDRRGEGYRPEASRRDMRGDSNREARVATRPEGRTGKVYNAR